MSKDDTVDFKVKISKLEDAVNKVVRRTDEIQKSVDLLFQDREILEDLQASFQHVKELVIRNQQHQDTARTFLQADIKVVGQDVQDVKSTLGDHTVVVKTKSKGLFNKLMKLFKREEVR